MSLSLLSSRCSLTFHPFCLRVPGVVIDELKGDANDFVSAYAFIVVLSATMSDSLGTPWARLLCHPCSSCGGVNAPCIASGA